MNAQAEGGPAGHQRRTMPGTLFATGHTTSDKQEPFSFQILRAPDTVLKQRIPTIDDDIARFQMRQQLFNKLVHGVARLDQHHHAPRPLEMRHQFLNRVRPNDFGALGFLVQEIIHLGHGPVVNCDGESVIVHVEDKVLSHDRQAYQCNIRCWFHQKICLKVG